MLNKEVNKDISNYSESFETNFLLVRHTFLINYRDRFKVISANIIYYINSLFSLLAANIFVVLLAYLYVASKSLGRKQVYR